MQNIFRLFRGQPKRYKATARPLWLEAHLKFEMMGIIGKHSDVHEEHMQLEDLKERQKSSIGQSFTEVGIPQLLSEIVGI